MRKKLVIVISLIVLLLIVFFVLNKKNNAFYDEDTSDDVVKYISNKEFTYKGLNINLSDCIYDKYTKAGQCTLNIERLDGTNRGLHFNNGAFGNNEDLVFEINSSGQYTQDATTKKNIMTITYQFVANEKDFNNKLLLFDYSKDNMIPVAEINLINENTEVKKALTDSDVQIFISPIAIKYESSSPIFISNSFIIYTNNDTEDIIHNGEYLGESFKDEAQYEIVSSFDDLHNLDEIKSINIDGKEYEFVNN